MVPVLTAGGRSFKGAALYYLHDKRRAGEGERLTSERVAWTQTVNLPTDDPERASRMMATTALKADELKAAAGIKATGRKLTTPAFAYSLSWHPTESPTKEEQIDAARETLQRLGLSEHQALIVCHNDEPQPHVHVIVNRVHPAEGKAATLSNSKLVLSQWAQAYEESRGKILCQQRQENNARRRQGQHVRAPRIPRRRFESTEAIKSGSVRAELVRADQKGQDARLSQAGRDMHDRHRREWEELKGLYRTGKDRIYARADHRRQAREAELKAQYKPHWAVLFAKQRGDRRIFEGREASPLGKLWNMAQTARELRRTGITASFLAMAWGVLSGQERRNAFELAQERERKALARSVSRHMAAIRADTRLGAKREVDHFRAGYLDQCTGLRDQQGREREAMKLAWTKRNAEREGAYAALSSRLPREKASLGPAQQSRTGRGARGQGFER